MSSESSFYRISLQPKGLEMQVAQGESLYQAAQRQGIRMPLSCKNGVCHICKASLLEGNAEVAYSGLKKPLSVMDGAAEEVLLCQFWPKSDCELLVKDVYARGELPLNEVVCQIEEVSVLAGHVYRARLSFSAGKLPEFHPGQYLSLHLPGSQEGRYFSIASAPGKREIELHIQADPHLDTAVEIVEYLKQASSVDVKLPYGKACLPELPDSELILIAAGTGFAQMKSILEALLYSGFDKPLSLYWGARQEQELYLKELPERWAREYSNFSFVPLVSEAIEDGCTRHHDQMANAVCADQHDFARSLVFVSGSPNLVFSTLDRLEQEGLNESGFYSDVLEYMQRPKF